MFRVILRFRQVIWEDKVGMAAESSLCILISELCIPRVDKEALLLSAVS